MVFVHALLSTIPQDTDESWVLRTKIANRRSVGLVGMTLLPEVQVEEKQRRERPVQLVSTLLHKILVQVNRIQERET